MFIYYAWVLLTLWWSATGHTLVPSGISEFSGGLTSVNPLGGVLVLVKPETRVSGRLFLQCTALMDVTNEAAEQTERWYITVFEAERRGINWKTCPSGEVLRAMTKSDWMLPEGEEEGHYN